MAKQPDLWISAADLERFAPTALGHVDKTVVDALGRAWVSDADARAALDGVEREQQAELDARQAYSRWVDAREAKRQEVAAKIRNEAGAPTMPASSAAVSVRVREALAAFDEREPLLGFYEWRDAHPRAVRAAR